MNLDVELALLAAAVYLPTWDTVEAAIAPDWQLVAPFEVDGTEAMLCRRGATCTGLAFRGTQFSDGVLSDIMANFGGWTYLPGIGDVHAGYATYCGRVYEAAAAAARQLAGAPLYVLGHSLGGSAANVFTARANTDLFGPKIDALVTFGAPRCFNRQSALSITSPIRRHVMRGDFAPQWPLNPWLRHAGEAIQHEPLVPRMSPIARHWVEGYQTVIARDAAVQ